MWIRSFCCKQRDIITQKQGVELVHRNLAEQTE